MATGASTPTGDGDGEPGGGERRRGRRAGAPEPEHFASAWQGTHELEASAPVPAIEAAPGGDARPWPDEGHAFDEAPAFAPASPTTETGTAPTSLPSASEPRTSVAGAIAATLARLGVGHAFGVVGSGNFELVAELRFRGVPYTAARHEGGAATMADAFARVSGRLAVVTTHQGCGYTNALTGIGEAAKSRTPLLVLTAAAPAAARTNNFRMDQDAAAQAVGAVAERVHSARTAAADAAHAWRTAVVERRTVVLSVPIDLLGEPTDEPGEALAVPGVDLTNGPVSHRTERRAGRPGVADLDRFWRALDAAERPVFIAGRGAREAAHEIAALAERVGALLATSAVAKGLFRGDPDGRAPRHGGADLGIAGGFSTPLAAELIAGADLVVSWGCALNGWTTRHGRLIADDATVVQIDAEPSALGAHRPIDHGIVGDCATVAADALSARDAGHFGAPDGRPADAAATGYRTPDVLQRIRDAARWRDVPFDALGGDAVGRVDPRTVTIALDDALPPARIVAIDSGNFMGYPSQFLEVPDVAGFCFTQAFQAVGLGLATAIGAAIARPDRLPVLGTGDGGFHMAIAELETAVRLGVPLVVLVYNDASYSAEVHHFGQRPVTGGAGAFESVVFPDTDFAAIARGFGARGLTVRGESDLPALADAVREQTRMGAGQGVPLVIDAKIASDGGSWWLAEAFRAH